MTIPCAHEGLGSLWNTSCGDWESDIWLKSAALTRQSVQERWTISRPLLRSESWAEQVFSFALSKLLWEVDRRLNVLCWAQFRTKSAGVVVGWGCVLYVSEALELDLWVSNEVPESCLLSLSRDQVKAVSVKLVPLFFDDLTVESTHCYCVCLVEMIRSRSLILGWSNGLLLL